MNHQAQTPSACAPPPAIRTRLRLLAGLLALFMSALGLWMSWDLRKYPCEHAFHHGIDSPVLAVELASNGSDLRTAISPPCLDRPNLPRTDAQAQARSTLRRDTYADCFFIPLYASFVWILGGLFAVRADGSCMKIRHLLAGVVIATSVADYLEDRAIFRALSLDSSDWVAQQICWPSRFKWAMLGIALLLTTVILLRSGNPIYCLATRRLFAIAYAASGAMILGGLWLPVLIGLAMKLFAVIVLLHIFALLGPYVAGWIPTTPPVYEDNFCERKKKAKVDVAVHP
jgi:hypothetical protein